MERIKLLLKSVDSGMKGPFFFTRSETLPKRRLKSCNLSLSLSLFLSVIPLSFLVSLDLVLSPSFLSHTHS